MRKRDLLRVTKFHTCFLFFLLVSFYGDSFVALKMEEASYQTALQLRFITSKPHGLLFLAAGKRDYCLMELQSGNLQV